MARRRWWLWACLLAAAASCPAPALAAAAAVPAAGAAAAHHLHSGASSASSSPPSTARRSLQQQQQQQAQPAQAQQLKAGISNASASSNSSSGSSNSSSSGSSSGSKPCACPLHLEPVCGVDGTTFGNACAAKCRGVAVAYKGECSSSSKGAGKQPPACKCPKLYAPVCTTDKRTFNSECEAECAGAEVDYAGLCGDSKPPPASAAEKPVCQCSKQLKEVCGRDGKTYANECLAVCAGTAVASQGRCGGKGGSANATLSSGNATATNGSSGSNATSSGKEAAPKKAAECKLPCPDAYTPVCGADGRTYSSACAAACRSVAVVSDGICGGGSSGSSPGRKPGCVCMASYDPVCGRNNRTYANACEADCEGVGVAAKGNCKASAASTSGGSKPGGRPPSGGCVCTAIYAPVCTTSGKTRGNKCEALCRDETVAREGECGDAVTTEKARPQPAAASAAGPPPGTAAPELAEAPAPRRRPGCVCITLYAPVCGEDGNTYGNSCEAACSDVKVARQGPCSAAPGAAGDVVDVPRPGSDDAPPPPAAVKPGCNVCPAVFAPVCGANNVTYSNECEATCRGKTSIAHTGPCKSNATKAAAGTGAASGAGQAKCLAECPNIDKPVCGTDGQLYRNPCNAKCRKVDIAYPGECRAECASCPRASLPYCVNSPTYGPRTFGNCCFAKCSGVAIIKEVLHPGACREKCTTKCDAGLERPLCCKGRTYKNGCFALCNGEDTKVCSNGRCSSVAGVEQGLACLLGPCPVKCNGSDYSEPVCGSDGLTYPNKCSLLCSQRVAIVAQGKCGACAPDQLPGGFPHCTADDRLGVSPVCGADGVTYRNSLAAKAAKTSATTPGSCSSKKCGEEGEACFQNGSARSTCCPGMTCAPDDAATMKLEASLAQKLGSGVGVCQRS